MNKKSFLEKTAKYDVISFDIFDTLICRDVFEPNDIFKLVGKACSEYIDVDEYIVQRISAEKKARVKFAKQEVSLDEIYSVMNYSLQVASLLKKTEVDLEISHCYPRTEIVELYNKIVKQKRVVIVSDMYLSRTVIKIMLEKCEIKNYDALYISNEVGVSKKSSDLFKYVAKKENVNPSQILHIGDSLKADCFGAWRASIDFMLVSRKDRFRRLVGWK